MATSVFQILIKLAKQGNADKETISSLYKLKASMGDLMGVAGAVTGVAFGLQKAYQATAVQFQNYAGQVREVTNVTGGSAEEASRLIQVTDDLEVSQETLLKAMKELASSGIPPTVDSLANLSDKYLRLEPGVARVNFLMDTFGSKTGPQMARVMEQGGEAIRSMSAAVSQGLVLNEAQMRQAEEQKAQLDQLNDMWNELAITIGLPVGNAFMELLDATAKNSAMTRQQHMQMAYLNKALDDGVISLTTYALKIEELDLSQFATEELEAAEAVRNHGDALDELPPSYDAAAKSALELAQAERQIAAQSDILRAALSGDLQQAYDEYISKTDETKVKQQELLAELQRLTDEGFAPNSAEVQAVNAALRENAVNQMAAARATELATSKMIYQNVAAKLDVKGQLELAKALGLISERDYAVASALDSLTQKFIDQSGMIPTEKMQDYIKAVEELKKKIQNLPDDQVINITTNYTTNGTPPPTTPPPTTNPPTVPPTADGGMFMFPQLRQIAEAGPEAVIPLKNGAVPVTITGGGMGMSQNIYVTMTMSQGASMGDFLQTMMQMAGR